MKTVLVLVADTNDNGDDGDNMDVRHLFRDAHEWSYTVEQQDIKTHILGWQRNVKLWTCSERDLQAVVDQLTKWHGDREIRVFKLSTVYYRTVGELNSKAVTKDGVLPF